MGFHHLDQAGLELLSSGTPPAAVSQSARFISMSHHAQPEIDGFIRWFPLPLLALHVSSPSAMIVSLVRLP